MTQANTQPRTLPPDQDMMRAMLAGDADYDGIFVFAVRTTGIVCRPSCHARKPRPDHVEFFRDGREAMFAGYRACRRCWPMGAREAPPTWVATILDHVHRRTPQRMRDSDLRALAIEPSRARRWFKQNYGMTFQSYQRAIRLGGAFERIRKGEKMASLGLD